MSDKEFWDLVKPFLPNKGRLANSHISPVKNYTVITNQQELTDMSNDHYVNLGEKSSGKIPISLDKDTGIYDDH